MNFDLDEQQEMLRDELASLLDRACDRETLRSVVEGQQPFQPGLHAALADLGMIGAAIPEELGGSGFTHRELCVVAEQLGRSLAPVPVTSTIFLVAEALLVAGSDEQKTRWLPQLASGKAVAAAAFTEKAGLLETSALACRVIGGRLSGAKVPVVDGGCADFYLVMARDPDVGAEAVSLFIVDGCGPNVRRQPVSTIDLLHRSALVEFDGAACERLGQEGCGIEIAARIFDRAAVLIAFEQVGGAGRCLEMARDYAKQRTAFGRQIGSFQAVKHMLSDMYVSLTLARSNALHGAWALAEDPSSLPLAAATARLSASNAYLKCAQNGLHIHGGLGFTWEADCHLHLRRANALALLLGPASRWEKQLVACMASIDPALLPS